MVTPVWVTTEGSLGTIKEGKTFSLTFEATDPALGTITYSHIAGTLPSGLFFTTTTGALSGLPTQVDTDIESQFVIRATNSLSEISDRTFEIVVTGQDRPVFITDTYLGAWRDSTYLSIQLEATDPDPNDILTWELVQGSLPPEISLDRNTGLITGFPQPATTYPIGKLGFDNAFFDEIPFDQELVALSETYTFNISITDGIFIETKQFYVDIIASNYFTADTTFLTADLEAPPAYTADKTGRVPVITTLPTDLGTFRHDNYFAFLFTGIYYADGELEWVVSSGAMPPGLILDSVTGYIYGILPSIAPIEIEYTFSLTLRLKDIPTIESVPIEFTMSLIGDIDKTVTWTEIPDMVINTGETSCFKIEALNNEGIPFLYTVTTGSLPPGLSLNLDGLIIGIGKFGGTTFDINLTTFEMDTTTFERIYSFTIAATTPRTNETDSGFIQDTHDFTITLVKSGNLPYENLILQAYPDSADRDALNSFLTDRSIFPIESLYRSSDDNFGVVEHLRILMAYGLDPEKAEDYVNAMANNHYNKKIRFGDLKLARSFDGSGSPCNYEVIYAEIIDDQENKLKESTSLSFVKNNQTIEPNSYDNMRGRMNTAIGINYYSALPHWMQSVQEDGKVIGFIPAVAIAYVNVGAGQEILYNIQNNIDFDLNKINFNADRYRWDTYLTNGFDKDINKFTFEEFEDRDGIEIASYLKFPKVGVFT